MQCSLPPFWSSVPEERLSQMPGVSTSEIASTIQSNSVDDESVLPNRTNVEKKFAHFLQDAKTKVFHRQSGSARWPPKWRAGVVTVVLQERTLVHKDILSKKQKSHVSNGQAMVTCSLRNA